MLPKGTRLTGERLFRQIFRTGKVERTDLFRVHFLPAEHWQFAVVVPKKLVALSVWRHRLARQTKAVLLEALQKGISRPGRQAVLVLTKSQPDFSTIRKDIQRWLKI